MSTKPILAAAVAALAFSFAAKAQTNVQTFYDFGKDRKYVTTTFEMFKGDKFGDTFFFIDHYYNSTDKNLKRLRNSGPANGSYFEIERGINFWQDSNLKDFSLHLEYDGLCLLCCVSQFIEKENMGLAILADALEPHQPRGLNVNDLVACFIIYCPAVNRFRVLVHKLYVQNIRVYLANPVALSVTGKTMEKYGYIRFHQ